MITVDSWRLHQLWQRLEKYPTAQTAYITANKDEEWFTAIRSTRRLFPDPALKEHFKMAHHSNCVTLFAHRNGLPEYLFIQVETKEKAAELRKILCQFSVF